VTCRRCGGASVNDHTPMGDAGICLWCRPGVAVVCSRCGADCPGAFDGLMRCPACRAGWLGEQQYEDKQRAQFEWLVRQGVITATGEITVPLTDVESSVRSLFRHVKATP